MPQDRTETKQTQAGSGLPECRWGGHEISRAGAFSTVDSDPRSSLLLRGALWAGNLDVRGDKGPCRLISHTSGGRVFATQREARALVDLSSCPLRVSF